MAFLQLKLQDALPKRASSAHRRSAEPGAPQGSETRLIQRKPACACGGRCPSCQAEQIAAASDTALAQTSGEELPRLTGALSSPSSMEESSEPAPDDAGMSEPAAMESEPRTQDDEAEPLAGNAACPVNAVFSSNVAGSGKANCLVPQGQYGAARLAQYMVRGISPIPSGGVTIDEQFKTIDDPYSIASLLQPQSATTDSTGKFDDCYRLASKNALPPDFRLKVAQNHLYNGQAIGKNVITYTANGVDVRHCKRKPNSCDFSDVCRLS